MTTHACDRCAGLDTLEEKARILHRELHQTFSPIEWQLVRLSTWLTQKLGGRP